MKKWEYIQLHIDRSNSRIHLQGSGIYKIEKFPFFHAGEKDKAFSMIEKLGLEGWELVSADNDRLWFKRPLTS